MNAAVAQFLLEDLPSGSHVGIVTFSTEAYETASMTELGLRNGSARWALVNKLPKRTITANLHTDTGKGLLKGLEVC